MCDSDWLNYNCDLVRTHRNWTEAYEQDLIW